MTTKKMTIESNSTAYEAADKVVETAKSTYLVVVLTVLGIFAFITAVLVAWPGIAYIASQLF
jgi:hypothetical protein